MESLLFGSAITNDTNIIFITCDRLSDAKYPLIDEKLHKTIGAIKLTPTKNWNLLKRESKEIKTILSNLNIRRLLIIFNVDLIPNIYMIC